MPKNWSTKNEIEFLKCLAGYCENATEDLRARRLRLLLGYEASMRRRTSWGDMNVKKIEGYVKKAILEVEGMMQKG